MSLSVYSVVSLSSAAPADVHLSADYIQESIYPFFSRPRRSQRQVDVNENKSFYIRLPIELHGASHLVHLKNGPNSSLQLIILVIFLPIALLWLLNRLSPRNFTLYSSIANQFSNSSPYSPVAIGVRRECQEVYSTPLQLIKSGIHPPIALVWFQNRFCAMNCMHRSTASAQQSLLCKKKTAIFMMKKHCTTRLKAELYP